MTIFEFWYFGFGFFIKQDGISISLELSSNSQNFPGEKCPKYLCNLWMPPVWFAGMSHARLHGQKKVASSLKSPLGPRSQKKPKRA